jgi:hypothetical protein
MFFIACPSPTSWSPAPTRSSLLFAGFATGLPLEGKHTLQISIFAHNADTVTSTLVADAASGPEHIVLELV